MKLTIENTLKILGDAIAQQIEAAEKRAAEADARLEAIKLGIMSVFDGLNPPNLSLHVPANDDATPPPLVTGKRLSPSDNTDFAAIDTDLPSPTTNNAPNKPAIVTDCSLMTPR